MAKGPGAPDPELLSAMHFHQLGRVADAEKKYLGYLSRFPNDPAARSQYGILLSQAGRGFEAVDQFELAVHADPQSSVLRSYFAFSLRDAGLLEDAVVHFVEATRLDPKSSQNYFHLGNALLKLNRFQEAIDAYVTCTKLEKTNFGAWLNLGLSHFRNSNYQEAILSYQKARELNRNAASVWLNLGDAYLALKDLEQAEKSYRKGLELAPQDADGWANLGTAVLEKGSANEAMDYLQKSLSLQPDAPKTRFEIARALHLLKRNSNAEAEYRAVLEKNPGLTIAAFNLGIVLADQGKTSEAMQAFQSVSAISDDPLAACAEVRSALIVPVIARSQDEIQSYREKVISKLNELISKEIHIGDPQSQIGTPGFYLAYQGVNNRELHCLIAQSLMQAVPDLVWTAPHIQKARPNRNRIRVAFISAHLKEHTVGRITAGLIEQLDRTRFEVWVMRPSGTSDEFSRVIDKMADVAVELPPDFRLAREIVADKELDIIYYPDIGMEPFTYYLAFSRLAQKQFVGWGHAETTGIPNIDAYLSCRHFEPTNGQAYYSEKLIELDRINNFYDRPADDFKTVSRSELGAA